MPKVFVLLPRKKDANTMPRRSCPPHTPALGKDKGYYLSTKTRDHVRFVFFFFQSKPIKTDIVGSSEPNDALETLRQCFYLEWIR